MSAAHTPGPWIIGQIGAALAIYHNERDPFAKFGAKRIVDYWCGSERLARECLTQLEFEVQS